MKQKKTAINREELKSRKIDAALTAGKGGYIFVSLEVHKKTYHVAVWKNGCIVFSWVTPADGDAIVAKLEPARVAIKKVVCELYEGFDVTQINIDVIHRANLKQLVKVAPAMVPLLYCRPLRHKKFMWLGDNGVSFDRLVTFVGKTGYGKSSTINAIINRYVFNAHAVESCTSSPLAADFLIRKSSQYKEHVSFIDLPGYGESLSLNQSYVRNHSEYFFKSKCIVYVLRADQRDFSDDIVLFKAIRKYHKNPIVGLNCVDKIEPVIREPHFKLTTAQQKNIAKVMDNISKTFKVNTQRIIPYSAKERHNLHLLTSNITSVLVS